MSSPIYRRDDVFGNGDSYAATQSIPHVLSAGRGAFIVKTYLHLLGAILAFVAIEAAIFNAGYAERIGQMMVGRGAWLVVLGGFMIVGWLATKVANTSMSLPAQYLALAGYVLAEAIIFVPLLYVANVYVPGAIRIAAMCTLLGFGGLTLVAFGTRKDFSFLRGVLMWSGICALVAIIASAIFGFTLGVGFSILLVAVAGGSILYDTSNVIHHYSEDRYVAASLSLFASVALLFWYILRIVMAARR